MVVVVVVGAAVIFNTAGVIPEIVTKLSFKLSELSENQVSKACN